jgi:hypothetical protein
MSLTIKFNIPVIIFPSLEEKGTVDNEAELQLFNLIKFNELNLNENEAIIIAILETFSRK